MSVCLSVCPINLYLCSSSFFLSGSKVKKKNVMKFSVQWNGEIKYSMQLVTTSIKSKYRNIPFVDVKREIGIIDCE